MLLHLEILDVKDLTGNTWLLCKASLLDYLEKLKPSFYEYIIQRKIVKNKYLNTILKTVIAGEPVPIITLTTSNKLNGIIKGNDVDLEMQNVEILDGLQRTFRLWAYYKMIEEYNSYKEISAIDFAKNIKNKYPEFFDSGIITLTQVKEYLNDHTFEKIEDAFRNFEVYFFIWGGLSSNKAIHKMLLLNAGQKPVSLTHQYELLFLYVWEDMKETSGIKLYRDRDPIANKIKLGDRQVGEYMFSSVIAGLRSYVENKPKKISIDDLDIEDFQLGENGVQINEDIFTRPFIEIFLKKLKEVDISVSQREGDDGLKWFVRDTTISGLLAGLGKYAKVNETMDLTTIQRLTIEAFDALNIKVLSSGFNLEDFQKEYYNLQSRTINVGTYVRSIIMDYTFDLLTNNSPNWRTLFSQSKSKS